MKPRVWLLSAILFAILIPSAARAQTAGIGEIRVSSDAERFDALKVRTGALLDYASTFDYAGLAIETTHYTQEGWSRDAPAVLVVWRKQNRDTLAGTVAEAGLVRVSGRTRLIGDATWSLRRSPRTGFEFLAASNLVETRPALERAIASTFGGVSAEQQLTRRLTVIGLAGYQRFSDGNERVHLRGRLIWMLLPEHGVSAQLRLRQYESQQLQVNDAYFNPGRYREWQAGLATRKRVAGWTWTGIVAAGREQIDSDDWRTTMRAEIRTEGAIGERTHLVLFGSYQRSADDAVAAADSGYWSGVVGVTVVIAF